MSMASTFGFATINAALARDEAEAGAEMRMVVRAGDQNIDGEHVAAVLLVDSPRALEAALIHAVRLRIDERPVPRLKEIREG